jgi:hypothetical protein
LTLTDGELEALRNLAQKKSGLAVGWISIAQARGLTDLGFAARTQSGWQITAAGAALLEQQGAQAPPDATVVGLDGQSPPDPSSSS